MKRALVIAAAAVVSLAGCRNWDDAYKHAFDAGTSTTGGGGATGGGATGGGATGGGAATGGGGGAMGGGGGMVDAGPCGGNWCLFSQGIAAFEATQGVFATGPNEAYVTTYGARAQYWNGTTWTTRTVSGSGMISSAVWGFAPNKIILAGDNGESYLGPPFGATQELTTATFENFQAIHGLSDGGSIFAAADWSVKRLDNFSVWATMNVPPRVPSNAILRGIAVISDTNMWAAGTAGNVLHSDDGANWSRLDAGVSENIRRVWANGANDVWFVGASGLVLRWNGTDFVKDYCPVCGDLWGVWGRGSNDMWLLDSDLNLVHYDGGTYTQLNVLPPVAVPDFYPTGLYGAGDRDLFLSGNLPDGGGGALHVRR